MADFTHYPDRRKFTDAVHENMVPKVYAYLGWEQDNGRDENYRQNAGINKSILMEVL